MGQRLWCALTILVVHLDVGQKQVLLALHLVNRRVVMCFLRAQAKQCGLASYCYKHHLRDPTPVTRLPSVTFPNG